MLVSSMGPLDDAGALRGMIFSNRALFECARRTPFLLSLPVSAMAAIATWNPAWRLSGLAPQLCAADQVMLADGRLRALLEADVGEALRDPGATRHELALLAKSWGLALDAIRVPVVIVHGDADHITPLAMADSLAMRVPGSIRLVRCGEGHFLIFRHWRGVLRLLVKHCRRRRTPRRFEAPRSAALCA
jgi:pimeloyl-ACP methyl ester carboxylesterase